MDNSPGRLSYWLEMADQTQIKHPEQNRFESVLKVIAPALDLILTAGERISKQLSPSDPDYYPVEKPSDSDKSFTEQ